VKLVAQFVVALYLAGGALAWSAYAAWVYAYRDLNPESTMTTKLVFYGGRALYWVFGAIVGGTLVGGAAAAMWKAIG